jgi:hypothetical protein
VYFHEELTTNWEGVNIMLREWKIILSVAVFLVTMPLEIPASGNEHGDHEEFHPHRLELSLGNTHEHGEDGFTVGLKYEYRLQELFGIGAFWEYAAGHFDKWNAALPIFIHPYRGLRFVLAPGLEHRDDENEFLFRTGVAYEFEIGRWSITPEFNVDFVDGEEAYVYGLSFGWGF